MSQCPEIKKKDSERNQLNIQVAAIYKNILCLRVNNIKAAKGPN